MDPDLFWKTDLLRANVDVLFSCSICPYQNEIRSTDDTG